MFNSLKKIFSSNESSEENTNEISSLLTRLQQQQQSQIDLIKAQTEAIKHKDNYIELLLNETKVSETYVYNLVIRRTRLAIRYFQKNQLILRKLIESSP